MRWLACLLALCAGCDLLVDIHPLKGPPPDAAPDAGFPFPCSGISMLADDFASHPLDLMWDAYGGANVITQQNNAADIISSVQGAYSTLQSKRFYDIREGRFSIQLTDDGNLDNDDNVLFELDSERAGYSVAFARTGGMVYFENSEAGSLNVVKVVPYAADMQYLRFSVTGTDVTWETSADGKTYLPRITTANHGMTFVRALVQTLVGEASPPFVLHVAHVNGDVARGSACPIKALTDTFTDPVLAPQWGRSQQFSGVLDINNQQLRMTTTVGAPAGEYVNVYLEPSAVYEMTAGSVTVEIPQMVSTAPTAVGSVSLGVTSTLGDEMVMVERAGTLACETKQLGNPATPATMTYVASTMRWWRIAHTSDNTTCEISSDGTTWSVLTSVGGLVGFDQVDVRVSTTSTIQVSDSARFDNFNLPL